MTELSTTLPDQQKLEDSYTRLRQKVAAQLAETQAGKKWSDKMVAGKSLSEWMEYVAMLPDLFHLSIKLLFDREVPLARKAPLIAAVVYVVTPLDIIPDVIPVLGQMDDLVILAKALQLLIDRDDPVINAAIQRHWAGSNAALDAVSKVVEVSDNLLLSLPAGVTALVRKLSNDKS